MKSDKEKKRAWSRLDNAAKIFPPSNMGTNTCVFRFSCDLKEEVSPELLQKATLVVESRCEGDMGALHRAARALSAEGGRIVFSQAKALPMASSDIRAGKAPVGALPPETEQIAGEYHLYGR